MQNIPYEKKSGPTKPNPILRPTPATTTSKYQSCKGDKPMKGRLEELEDRYDYLLTKLFGVSRTKLLNGLLGCAIDYVCKNEDKFKNEWLFDSICDGD